MVHDDIDLSAELTHTIHFDYTQEQLNSCFRICFELWKQGVERGTLDRLLERIQKVRYLSEEEQLSYKHIRAKLKHLRFAFIVLDKKHKYPWIFHATIALMGNLQDVLKNKKHNAISRFAFLVRFFTTKPIYALSLRALKQFTPCTPESFQIYVNNEIEFIRKHLSKGAVTSKEFHEMRKVISRQVALYDNLKTLYPCSYHRDVSRFLSTINGLMGNLHDELITKKLNKAQDYYLDTFRIPDKIFCRLQVLVNKYLDKTIYP
ncbi:MAG: hypothetical protein COW84_04640 [Gammaproteobacteria bacterium CG22_combo_CG10-13_8_21_14_all_40_8]|nr:MAG: hypothetical protein COW84_04640 [Gammaproteobacteria bacterium CG22_combo_CG10-13_8_21_14_all_40_8]